MKEILIRLIKNLNKAIDDGDFAEYENNREYYNGKVTAYIDAIVDIANEIGVDTDIDPRTGHMFIIAE